jgi:hypothetical protein
MLAFVDINPPRQFRCSKDFVNLSVIYICPERLFNCFHVGLVLVCGDLWSSHDTKTNVRSEVICPPLAATANQIGHAEFGISIDGNPSPCITPASSFLFRRSILGFGSDELPNFVALNSFCSDGAYLPVMKTSTGAAHVFEQIEDGVLGDPGHAARRIDGHAFD